MLFFAEHNGQYIKGLLNYKGEIVYKEFITLAEYQKYINGRRQTNIWNNFIYNPRTKQHIN